MKDQKSKIAFIVVLYKTPKNEIGRLKKEIDDLGLKNKEVYFIDNTGTKKGYAEGVNEGIRKGLKDGADLFVVMNPDVSLLHLRSGLLLEGAEHFDIWGFAMKQHGKTYYGGIIDPWRMSGGLVEAKPKKRFVSVDFVSGSLMVIKKEVIDKIGLYDETYFMYYEDVDYCVRVKKAGFKIGMDSKIKYEHFESTMFGHDRTKLLDRAYGLFFERYSSVPQKIYALVHRILSSSFLFNFFSLNLSSLVVKFTSFINFLFLVRFLTAPEYGIYTLVWAQVTILSPLSDFGTTSYGVVYLPTENERKMQSLFSFRMFVSFIVFLITVLLSLILFRGSVKMYGYILVTATVIFTNMFSGSYFILNAIKGKLYRSSRNSIIFNVFLVSVIAISLIISHRLLAVFLMIFIFYNAYSFINFLLVKKELPSFIFKFEFKEWSGIFKKLYVFVLIGFFAGLYSRIDVFLLKLLKGETEVGIYSAGSKFLEALLFLPASYNVTATPILARLSQNAESLKRKITKDVLFLTILGFGIAIGLSLFSPFFLTYIFKKNYISSIPVLQIVIFALPFLLLNSVWLNILYVLKKSYLVVIVFLVQTILNVTLNLIFIPRYSYIASSYITVLSEVLNCVVLFVITKYIWSRTFKKTV